MAETKQNKLNFNIFNSIILAGIIQGFIFTAIVLFSKKYRSMSTVFLAALILQFSLSNLQFYLADSGILTYKELYDTIYVPYQYVSGPLLLFYGLTLIHPDRNIPLGAKLTVIPFVLAFCASVAYKICVAAGYNNESVMSAFRMGPYIDEFFSIAYDIVIVVYLYVNVVKARIQERVFSLGKVHLGLGWFKTVLICFFFLSFVWLYCAVMDIFKAVDLYYALWIAMSAMIYWMGHIGIYKYGIMEERKKIRSYYIERPAAYSIVKQKSGHIASLDKLIVGEKRFFDPGLTLEKVAGELGLSKSHLSRIINSELGMSFTDYINTLRVEEAKLYLKNPDFSNYTLVAIGLESGFNSKSAFNSAFKKIASQTPSEFRNSMRNSS